MASPVNFRLLRIEGRGKELALPVEHQVAVQVAGAACVLEQFRGVALAGPGRAQVVVVARVPVPAGKDQSLATRQEVGAACCTRSDRERSSGGVSRPLKGCDKRSRWSTVRVQQ